jgi:hypothetical protein
VFLVCRRDTRAYHAPIFDPNLAMWLQIWVNIRLEVVIAHLQHCNKNSEFLNREFSMIYDQKINHYQNQGNSR